MKLSTENRIMYSVNKGESWAIWTRWAKGAIVYNSPTIILSQLKNRYPSFLFRLIRGDSDIITIHEVKKMIRSAKKQSLKRWHGPEKIIAKLGLDEFIALLRKSLRSR